MRKTNFFIIVLVSLAACTVTDKAQRHPQYSFQLGINKGGITENTDLSAEHNVQSMSEPVIDAFSGATRTGANAGLRINKPLRYGELETGIDYMYNHQTFAYADPWNMYNGIRKFNVNQIMFPLTYNFILFKKTLPQTEIQIKVGYVTQLNYLLTSESGTLPDYTLNRWSGGATLGISAYPFVINNRSKLGFFLDVYRGSRIYTDYYNQTGSEMPGSSYVKLGLKYKFNNKKTQQPVL